MAEAHPSAAAIVDLYRRHADVWIARRGPGPLFEQPWLDRFRALMPEAPNVLDLGCGSGRPIADYLIAHGAQITGVDASEPLLDCARGRHGAPHEWICADMRGLDLARRFDGIIAWHSFFHLTRDDQRAMFEVFRAHAKPGAALMFTSGGQDGESIGEWEGEPLYHASLAPEAYRAAVDGAGFDLAAHVISDPDCGGSTVWLAQRRT